jgi:hypothetical protein
MPTHFFIWCPPRSVDNVCAKLLLAKQPIGDLATSVPVCSLLRCSLAFAFPPQQKSEPSIPRLTAWPPIEGNRVRRRNEDPSKSQRDSITGIRSSVLLHTGTKTSHLDFLDHFTLWLNPSLQWVHQRAFNTFKTEQAIPSQFSEQN